jgi:hypothetical protein
VRSTHARAPAVRRRLGIAITPAQSTIVGQQGHDHAQEVDGMCFRSSGRFVVLLPTDLAVAGQGPARGQCPAEPCTPAIPPGSWTTGLTGGASQDCQVTGSTGQFPGAITAHIVFSKPPAAGNGCKFHAGGSAASNSWNRWADINLGNCANFGVKVDYDLHTFDRWVSGDPSHSDVFYASIGPYAFNTIGLPGGVIEARRLIIPVHNS